MPNYRRAIVPGVTYFFTIVTYQRHPWLCTEIARRTLKEAIHKVRQKYPFSIDAIVLLPDRLHCIRQCEECSTRVGFHHHPQ
jgi:putative transposase